MWCLGGGFVHHVDCCRRSSSSLFFGVARGREKAAAATPWALSVLMARSIVSLMNAISVSNSHCKIQARSKRRTPYPPPWCVASLPSRPPPPAATNSDQARGRLEHRLRLLSGLHARRAQRRPLPTRPARGRFFQGARSTGSRNSSGSGGVRGEGGRGAIAIRGRRTDGREGRQLRGEGRRREGRQGCAVRGGDRAVA